MKAKKKVGWSQAARAHEAMGQIQTQLGRRKTEANAQSHRKVSQAVPMYDHSLRHLNINSTLNLEHSIKKNQLLS